MIEQRALAAAQVSRPTTALRVGQQGFCRGRMLAGTATLAVILGVGRERLPSGWRTCGHLGLPLPAGPFVSIDGLGVGLDGCRRATQALGNLGDRQSLGLAEVARQRNRVLSDTLGGDGGGGERQRAWSWGTTRRHSTARSYVSEETWIPTPSRYCSNRLSPATSLLLALEGTVKT